MKLTLLTKILYKMKNGLTFSTKEGWQASDHLRLVMFAFEESEIPEYVEFSKILKEDYTKLCGILGERYKFD